MWLSSWATIASTIRMMLLVCAIVSRFSCSKYTRTGGSWFWSASTQTMQSIRFLAKRETAFVMIRSIFPSMASAISFLKPCLWSVLVPEKPSST